MSVHVPEARNNELTLGINDLRVSWNVGMSRQSCDAITNNHDRLIGQKSPSPDVDYGCVGKCKTIGCRRSRHGQRNESCNH